MATNENAEMASEALRLALDAMDAALAEKWEAVDRFARRAAGR